MLCHERSLVKHRGTTLTVHPLRCRCWSCEYCGPRRAKELRWKARDGQPTIMLTLTIRAGRYPTPDRQAVELAKGWRMLRQYLMRALGWKNLPFLIVFERHKSGWPHAHLLLRCTYINHKLIRDWWAARFDSPRVWISRLHDQRRAALYVSKYLAKAPTCFEGCKRYWCSQDWKIAKPASDAPAPDDTEWWEARSEAPLSIARQALLDGAKVTFDGLKLLIEWWDPMERERWRR